MFIFSIAITQVVPHPDIIITVPVEDEFPCAGRAIGLVLASKLKGGLIFQMAMSFSKLLELKALLLMNSVMLWIEPGLECFTVPATTWRTFFNPLFIEREKKHRYLSCFC